MRLKTYNFELLQTLQCGNAKSTVMPHANPHNFFVFGSICVLTRMVCKIKCALQYYKAL